MSGNRGYTGRVPPVFSHQTSWIQPSFEGVTLCQISAIVTSRDLLIH